MSRRWLAILITILFVVVSVVLVWRALPGQLSPFAAGLLEGFVSGVSILVIVYELQQPDLTATIEHNRYDPNRPWHFVHLRVTNSAIGFLGGGTAYDCAGKLEVGGKGSFAPKWVAKVEPYTEHLLPDGQGGFRVIQWRAHWLMDAARKIDLRPGRGQSQTIDVAVKNNTEEDCYIHEPENYLDASGLHKHPDPRARLPPGEYPFMIRFEYNGGTSKPQQFILVNGKGTDPSSLHLKARRSSAGTGAKSDAA